MRIERGTRRAQRRDAARQVAQSSGLPAKHFAEFWHAGGTREAAEDITKAARGREEAVAALARAVAAVTSEKGPA